MLLRKTKNEDIDHVMHIINQAKTYLKDHHINQWQDGYPNEDMILHDIKNDEAYVLENDGKIVGTCMVSIHGDPCYNYIDGKWLLNSPYICIHRIAVAEEYKGQGLAKNILDQAIALYPNYYSLRMDTHDHNISMQRFLEKYGFQYCGIITLASGDKRRAYEKRL